MLLLIVEIWLTVAAWRKGWRAWSLLPLGFTLLVAAVIGAAVEVSGGSIERVDIPVSLLLHVVCLGVLIGLAKRAPRRQLPAAPEVSVPTEEAVVGR